MRKLFSYLLLLCVFFLLFESCEMTDPDDPEDAIAGTWNFSEITLNYEGNTTTYTSQQVGMTQTMVVNSNGTYRITTSSEEGTEVESGTWSYDGTTLVFTTGIQSTSLPCTISGNRMQLTFPAGALDLDFYGSFILIYIKT